MKKTGLILASMLLFAGLTFAQDGTAAGAGKAHKAKSTSSTHAKTKKNTTAVKKVPASKAKAKPASTSTTKGTAK